MKKELDNIKFYTQEKKDVLKNLESSENGLSRNEVNKRQEYYGLNKISKGSHIHPLKILAQQFISPLIIILLFAIIISFAIGEWIDAIVISVIVLINAFLGFFQEYKAERSIEALQKMVSETARVIRSGKKQVIDTKFLVPGDIIILEEGDKVPADARLLEEHMLQTQEASLTGESLPQTKEVKKLPSDTLLGDRENMVYYGTDIVKGRSKAIVTATAMKTEFGKIAKMISGTEKELTPLQKKLSSLGKSISIIVIIIAIAITIIGLLKQFILFGNLTLVSFESIFILAVALAVAAIPEGLPAVVTIGLSLGIQRMAKRNALMRKLPSVETLGSVTVICTDKTGTLTHNEMTTRRIFTDNNIYSVTGSGYSLEGDIFQDKTKITANKNLRTLGIIGDVCNNSELQSNETKVDKNVVDTKAIGDPTEVALKVFAKKIDLDTSTFKRLDEIPFTSERKMMSVVVKGQKGNFIFTKGASDILLKKCDRIMLDGKEQMLTRGHIRRIEEITERFANSALRVLGFAYKKINSVNHSDVVDDKSAKLEENLVFVGLQGMIDPPRDDVKSSIKKANRAGIKVMMVTGDHPITAKAIAKEVGIIGKIMGGSQINELSDKELDGVINNIGIFARVSPKDKLRIVESLKRKGHIVSMTGDGVNDAPALKRADIGVAMGITGTDVSREASDMVLLDDHFRSITNAVEEGRNIFDNIRKFVYYLLSSNMGEVLTIFLAMILNLPLPLFAVQLLWINLITDGAPATALSVEPIDKDIMIHKPRPVDYNFVNKKAKWWIFFIGVIMTLGTLAVFIFALMRSGWMYGLEISGNSYVHATTMAFTTLVLFQLFNVFNCRHLEKSIFKYPFFKNKWLFMAIGFSLILQFIVVYLPFFNNIFDTTPLTFFEWIVCFLIASSVLWFNEIYKLIFNNN